MPENRTRIRIFVACPSDIRQERRRLASVVDDLNLGLADDKGLFLEIVNWQTHVAPDMGRPEAVILRQIQPEDIFVGILGQRFGTPTGKAESGTEEEFDLAYKLWEASGGEQGGRPRIMLYFNTAAEVRSREEWEQLGKVIDFRARLERRGLLCSYKGPADFERNIRRHLTNAIRQWRPGPARSIYETPLSDLARYLSKRGDRPLLTLVFTDIVGFSRLNLQLGEEYCDYLRDEYLRAGQELIVKNNGFLIKCLGDEILAVFTTPVAAINFSLDFQQTLREFDTRFGRVLPVRIGVNIQNMDADDFWLEARKTSALARLAARGQVFAAGSVRAPSPWRKDKSLSHIKWCNHGKASSNDFKFKAVWELLDSQTGQEPVPPRDKGLKSAVQFGGISDS